MTLRERGGAVGQQNICLPCQSHARALENCLDEHCCRVFVIKKTVDMEMQWKYYFFNYRE